MGGAILRAVRVVPHGAARLVDRDALANLPRRRVTKLADNSILGRVLAAASAPWSPIRASAGCAAQVPSSRPAAPCTHLERLPEHAGHHRAVGAYLGPRHRDRHDRDLRLAVAVGQQPDPARARHLYRALQHRLGHDRRGAGAHLLSPLPGDGRQPTLEMEQAPTGWCTATCCDFTATTANLSLAAPRGAWQWSLNFRGAAPRTRRSTSSRSSTSCWSS